ncbi:MULTISPECIES: futalosine hydrolase [Sphingobacterium]|uniref:Futalosine hydrolase n=1 Tax=Sphingobacterium populi TaxID=1812824 RepID=A0ABW5UD81_9SPHI|nr:futalosine hydrolase [Sphingobacterium sp. CFCC 11742]
MEILIVAATEREIKPSLPILQELEIDVLITGVGMVETAFALGERLATKKYDLLLNVGIAGSFSPDLPLGSVVEVTQDQFIELGAQNREEFLSIEEMGFGQSLFFSNSIAGTIAPTGLRQVHGITVNTVHGNAIAIEAIRKRLAENLTIESMEGAAVLHAAHKRNTPVIQVRAISNYVEPRDTSLWDIPQAIQKLHEWLRGYLISQQR